MRTSASSSSGANAPGVPGVLSPFGSLVALLVLPWSVVVSSSDVSLVFAWGLVNPDPFAVTTLPDYLFVHTRGLPSRLLAWPTSVFLYAGALASALGGRVLGREDRRVTAALLVLAGGEHLWFALGTSHSDVIVIPIATALLWTGAWLAYPR